MEYIISICIILGIISWILRTFVVPVANIVQTVNNNNFVNEYVLNNNLQNAMHFITTIKEGNATVNTNVLLADDGIHFPLPNGNCLKIPIEAIQYFVKQGDISYTNQVYSSGRQLSFGKAIVGGIIAGPIGAVVGGVSGAEKLENNTIIHDDTETYIYYYVNNNKNVAVLSINGVGFYQNIKLRFPNKEYGHINMLNNNLLIENATDVPYNEIINNDDIYSNKNVDNTYNINKSNVNVETLIERAFIFLEDGNFDRAFVYAERVLDEEPKNAYAYLIKLMIECRVRKSEDLSKIEVPFDNSLNYNKIIRYGDDKLKSTLLDYIGQINLSIENQKMEDIYNGLLVEMQNAKDELDYETVAKKFDEIENYKNSKELANECRKRADKCIEDKKEEKYNYTLNLMNNAICTYDYEKAIISFEELKDYKDSSMFLNECKSRITELNEKYALREKKIEKFIIIFCIGFVLFLICSSLHIADYLYEAGMEYYYKYNYNRALRMYDDGKLDEAYEIFNKLGNYGDSAMKTIEIGNQIFPIGYKFAYGTYEQDGNLQNGKEAINWLVLDRNEKGILVISDIALVCVPYNEKYASVTWETCTLRRWLNGDFYNTAFNDNEKMLIDITNVVAHKNPEYKTIFGGSETDDKIFLLSIEEVEKYFKSDEDRKLVPSAKSRGVYISNIGNNYTKDGTATCYWWLRTPGLNQMDASYVDYDGTVSYRGYDVSGNGYVRPAMWLNLNK